MESHDDDTPLHCIHTGHDLHHRLDVHFALPDQGHVSSRNPQDRRCDDCRSVTFVFVLFGLRPVTGRQECLAGRKTFEILTVQAAV